MDGIGQSCSNIGKSSLAKPSFSRISDKIISNESLLRMYLASRILSTTKTSYPELISVLAQHWANCQLFSMMRILSFIIASHLPAQIKP